MTLHVVILAAGLGKRMHSNIPKVLHEIAGKPMLSRVVDTASQLKPEAIHVVIGNGAAEVKKSLGNLGVNWIIQKQQLGTGHAVKQALTCIPEDANVLILYGDVPFIHENTLRKLINSGKQDFLTLLVANLENPEGLGRILRDQSGKVTAIIESRDANSEQQKIKEIYSGICSVNAKLLHKWLPNLTCANAQEEYYLTEIITMATQDDVPITTFTVENNMEIQGVNDRLQLQELERAQQLNLAKQLLLTGVGIADINRIDIRGELKCGQDSFIDVNNIFEGNVSIGKNCHIGPNCYFKNVQLADNCTVLANSVLEDCAFADNCQIGPFARIRPGTTAQENCKIGNFVETKNAKFAANSKANHLSYLGDVSIGKDVNIGAGTITCNYDGANKNQTIIEDGVFIGSDTQLVAPVRIGKNATIGAGSTIRKDVPAEELTLTESKQKTVSGWKRPKK